MFKTTFVGNTIVDQSDEKLTSVYKPVWFAEPSVALVGDNSFSAFTSPVQGERYRIQLTPTFGSVNYQTALLDYRRYVFLRPFTAAFRGVSIGRYGSGAEDPNTTWPIYLGDETMIRGYGYSSFSNDECQVNGTAPGSAAAQVGCPTFQRLFGSKAAVFNAEFRIPLFGTEGFGLINFPFLPTEVSPFFDGGVSYTNNQGPDFRFTRSANDIPAKCQATTNYDAGPDPAAGVLSVRRSHSGVQHGTLVPLQPDGLRDHGSVPRASVPASAEELGLGIPAGARLVKD